MQVPKRLSCRTHSATKHSIASILLLIAVITGSCSARIRSDPEDDERRLGSRWHPTLVADDGSFDAKFGGKVPVSGYTSGQLVIADIRFNKCPPIEETNLMNNTRFHKDLYPLLPADYPVAGTKAAILKHETMADSVVTLDDYQLYGSTPDEWMAMVKPPSFPISYVYAPYWEELRVVIHAQIARRNGDDPSTLSRWPDLWADFTLEDIAQAVNAEYPASLQQALISQVFSQGGLKMQKELTQFRSEVDFVGTQVRIAALNTWAFEAVAPVIFMLKWTIGMPRPEEMAWLIASGQYGLDDGVPQDIIDAIVGMNLTNATEFTAYT